MDIKKTLEERGNQHGKFTDHAKVTQHLKDEMHNSKNWFTKLDEDQREALEMIQHKIGRILSGDPNLHDHWHDIEGYAHLVAERLQSGMEL